MSEDKDQNSTSHHGFWLGMILGGLIGAAAAYWASTDDKDELKKDLLKKGKILLKNLDELKEEAQEKGTEIKEVVEEKVEKGVEEIPEVAQKAVRSVQGVADRAIGEIVKAAGDVENSAHRQARKFFLKQGKPLVKK